jgi:hypothetical protein
MSNTIDFTAKTGAGGVEVKVTMSFEADSFSSWNENIDMVTFEGVDIMGLLADEQFSDLETQGIEAIQAKREWEIVNYEP